MRLNYKELLKASNLISIFRILLIFPAAYFLSKMNENDSYRIVVLLLILGAFISDLLDGFVARKFNQITEFGKIIDPLADKIFVMMIIIQLYWMEEIPAYYFWIVIFRDIIIFFGGIYVTNIIGKVLPSNLLGKITVVSIGAFLITVISLGNEISWLYNFFMYLSLFFSFVSLFGYGIRAFENIKWAREN